LYSPLNIINIRLNKSRMMRCEWHVGGKGETRTANRILLGNPDGKGTHEK
jgi:hypothetical protein